MKKTILFMMMLVCNITLTFAQSGNDTVLYIANHPESMMICEFGNRHVYVYAQESCGNFHWYVNGVYTEDNYVVTDPQIDYIWTISYYGCEGFYHGFGVEYVDSPVPSSFTHERWKHWGASIQLEAVGEDSIGWPFMYNFHWNTGETDRVIDVSSPGTYTCEITGLCGTATRSFMIQDNVEIYRATVDLATGLNKVTWHTTPEQAEYISQVKVERDGMVVGTAPYEDGQFIDNIGSENAARNYRLTGITTGGDECPIPSYQYGTLHVDYSPNASNPNKLNMAWTAPFIEEGASIAVTYFQICKYDPATSEVTIVDQIGANNTIGSYDVSLFDGGYAVVAAMFNEGKDYEELSFSNLTDFLLGIGENEGQQCRVYPNPANGRFTVEGTGTMRITNVLGQEIMAKEIDGKETVALQKGLYFVKLNGATRKVVVE